MTKRDVFEYALVRVVPRMERGECFNAGVIVYCRAHTYVAARTHLDEAKLLALDPGADVAGGTGRPARGRGRVQRRGRGGAGGG